MLSVIIPTLNAVAELPATLASVREGADEIIVVDGGSTDATAEIARKSDVRLLTAPRGRGTQLRAGAEAATGAWLLFLHADARPAPGWRQAVNSFVATSGSEARAGYFALRLDDPAPAARRLDRLVAWRCRRLALPYGDQGLLISRTLYEAVGGFRPIPLMEDVDLARRLGRRRLAPIDCDCTVSARRYRAGGYVRRPARNLLCLSLYFAGANPRWLARLYG